MADRVADPSWEGPWLARDPAAVRDLDGILAAMPRRIDHLPRRWARETPEAPALLVGGAAITWAALDEAIDRTAGRLRRAGLRPGDRLMALVENGVAAVALLFAASRLDAWASLVNARMSGSEITAMRETAGVRLIAYGTGDSPAAARHAAADGAEEVEDPLLGRLALGAAQEGLGTVPEPVDPLAGQVAVLSFTSGTTGRPKAVMLSHRAVLYAGASQVPARGFCAADRLYLVAPLSHAVGLSSNLLAAAWVGAACLLAQRFDPADLAAAIRAGQVTLLVAVPQIYGRLLDWAAAEGVSLRGTGLRVLGAGGAPVDRALRDRVRAATGLTLTSGYGATELVPIARVPEAMDAPDDAIGLPSPGVEVRILRPDGTEAAPGEVGEILARGPSRMLGYYRDPEGTAAVLRPDGWVATGDLGRLDEDGCLRIAGRLKEMIIRSGFNVYPAEVEAVLNAHPAVMQSAVVGRRVAGNEEVVAFVQPATGAVPDLTALRAHLREHLAPYKIPAELIVAEMPIGPTGKILKSALKARAEAASAA